MGQPNSLAANANPLSSSNAQAKTGSRPFYALSGIFIVGQKITVPSNWGLIPDGLGTGDSFRLLIVSRSSNNADDTDIANYNSWVQTGVAAGHAGIRAYSDGFRVVASTAAVDARENTGTTYSDDDKGVPIYWLNGTKVADEYEDFYDGSWDDEANPKDESGSAVSVSPLRLHTGSGHDGTEAFTGTDSRALGATQVRSGWPNSSDSRDGPLSYLSSSSGDVARTTIRRFYALSDVLEVAALAVANNAPAFTATPPVTRSLAENTAAGENVGAPVAADDDDTDDSLTYSLGGTDAESFEIVATSGQIQTKAGVSYDHETKSSYSVDVGVTDGIASATIAVTITVTNELEPPAAPAPPAVLPTAGTTDSLDVSWTEPDNTGKPAITDYDVQYRAVGEATWTDLLHTGAALSATISGLDADTHYQVQVRATNEEGTGPWSGTGQGPTRGPPTEVPVHWGLIPDGLGPGDSFRLLFLTSTKRDASSTDINEYNAFAQARAADGHADIQAYSDGFAAVGSTAGSDARVQHRHHPHRRRQGPAHLLAGRQQGRRPLRGLLRRDLEQRDRPDERVRQRRAAGQQSREPRRHLHRQPGRRNRIAPGVSGNNGTFDDGPFGGRPRDTRAPEHPLWQSSRWCNVYLCPNGRLAPLLRPLARLRGRPGGRRPGRLEPPPRRPRPRRQVPAAVRHLHHPRRHRHRHRRLQHLRAERRRRRPRRHPGLQLLVPRGRQHRRRRRPRQHLDHLHLSRHRPPHLLARRQQGRRRLPRLLRPDVGRRGQPHRRVRQRPLALGREPPLHRQQQQRHRREFETPWVRIE